MNTSTNPVGFDNAQAASSYVAFTATLAAIVFAAIILLLSNPPKASEGDKKKLEAHVLNGLIVAFVSLSMASFLFIQISAMQGQPQDQILVFLLAIGSDILLSLAVLQLLLSLSWCFDSYGVDTTGVKLLLLGLIPPVAIYTVLSIGDYIWDIIGHDWKGSQYAQPLVLGGVGFLLIMPLGVGWLVRILTGTKHEDMYANAYKWALIVSGALDVILVLVFGLPDPPGKILGDFPFEGNYVLGFWLNFPLMFFVGLCETLYVIGMPKRKNRDAKTAEQAKSAVAAHSDPPLVSS